MNVEEIRWRPPIDAFASLAGEPHAHLLHAGDDADAEWSTIVAFPAQIFDLRKGATALLASIDELLSKRSRDRTSSINAPFQSGLVGYIGYEAFSAFEASLNLPASPYKLPGASFGVYDAAVVFNLHECRAFITGPNSNARGQLKTAMEKSGVLGEIGANDEQASNFSRNEYFAAVAQTIESIRDGDFYQANLSQKLATRFDEPLRGVDLFNAIATKSDAFFGAVLQYDSGAIVSNSPERFFCITPRDGKRRIVVEPIKGTRGRDADPDADAFNAEDLVADAKDRAENTMIADLMRNDLSRICQDHSIREEKICELMILENVHHLVSRISGELRADVSISDVFRALFPSGSITGAPKIAAMDHIAQTEKIGRGPYCGAIGYVDDGGGADFSVAIRTMIIDQCGFRLSIPVGGGITIRSDPESEYDETLVKAASALNAISHGKGRVE